MVSVLHRTESYSREQPVLVRRLSRRAQDDTPGYFWSRQIGQVQPAHGSLKIGATYSMKWRWDQGRLPYFAVDNIRAMARALSTIDGVPVGGGGEDHLRAPLEQATGLDFPPKGDARYPVWRNFKRVFECSMLASTVDQRLRVSDICRRLAVNEDYGADEYLYDFIPRFTYPFPAFSEQTSDGPEVYPFCAIGKLLVSSVMVGRMGITLADVFDKLIGNYVTGTEDLRTYAELPHSGYQPVGDEERQLREMLVFCSQLSFLKWTGTELILDVSADFLADANWLLDLFTPRPVVGGAGALFYRMTSLGTELPKPFNSLPASLDDDIFLEGGKSRMSHLRIERSPLVRRLYIAYNPEPLCDTCEKDMRVVYPWTTYMLEVHHLLPLSSPLVVELNGTSLMDVTGLCPNCHKSVHAYYGTWLKDREQHDFRSKDEAREVYELVKNDIRHD